MDCLLRVRRMSAAIFPYKTLTPSPGTVPKIERKSALAAQKRRRARSALFIRSGRGGASWQTALKMESTASSRHPERSEGSLLPPKEEILRCAQDDKHLRACLSCFAGEPKAHSDSGRVGRGDGAFFALAAKDPHPNPLPEYREREQHRRP
jgi:hypothetical protein